MAKQGEAIANVLNELASLAQDSTRHAKGPVALAVFVLDMAQTLLEGEDIEMVRRMIRGTRAFLTAVAPDDFSAADRPVRR